MKGKRKEEKDSGGKEGNSRRRLYLGNLVKREWKRGDRDEVKRGGSGQEKDGGAVRGKCSGEVKRGIGAEGEKKMKFLRGGQEGLNGCRVEELAGKIFPKVQKTERGMVEGLPFGDWGGGWGGAF